MPELILLGTGTAIPTPRRGPTASLVVDGDDVTLVDPGPGAVKRACDAGFPVPSIRRVLLTHHHPDHSLDLMALLFARRNPVLEAECAPLRVLGGPGTGRLIRSFRRVYGAWVTLPAGQLVVDEIGPGGFALSARVQGLAVAVAHTPASLAYRLTFAHGATLALSGDTDECAGAVDVARAADHYLLEAAMPDDAYRKGHLTPERAARIATAAECRHLILTHFYPPVDVEQARATAARLFRGRVTIAEDGMRVPLTRGDAA